MNKSCRTICVVTGTRAEYGLLRLVIQGIKDNPLLDLQLVVTGMHLSHEYGLTFQEIIDDGHSIDRRVEMLLSSDTPVGIAKSIGLGIVSFADVFNDLKPDFLLVLGDRFEIFAAASAALIARIPIIHCHGGELTEGAFDDAMRHSITKMSHLHFVAAEEYRSRVIQMGEDPSRVLCVGGLGVDSIKNINLLTRSELQKQLDFTLGAFNLLITFHPVTLSSCSSSDQLIELLEALDSLDDNVHLIFTLPNSDTESKSLTDLIQQFCLSRPHAKAFSSLGQLKYLSSMFHSNGVVGNSSSGLLEAPSLGCGALNIGDRQKGRLSADSVLHCTPHRYAISDALQTLLYDKDYIANAKRCMSPYGDGGASSRIIQHLSSFTVPETVAKPFFDISLTTTIPSDIQNS